MANETETKFDSGVGHVVLPILHSGSGEVHNIAVPSNTDPGELHDALLDAGYHSNWAPYIDPKVDPITGRPRPNYGPTKEGVLENDPKFKAAASKLWETAAQGKNSTESGTYLDNNLDRGPISTSTAEGKMSLVIPKDNTPYTLHTHPNHFNGTQAGGQPSDTDIQTAKKIGKSVYVVSKSGLQVVEKDGKVTNVYSNPDWATRDNK